MNRRLAVVALAVVIASGCVAALVADPLASQPEPATADATAESPGELALAALETTERRSYDVRYAVQHSSDEGPRVIRKRVDRAHHRVAVSERRDPRGEPNALWFLGECTTATRVGTDVGIRVRGFEGFSDPFYTRGVEPSDLDATVVDRTDDRVVVRVTNTSAAVSLVSERSDPGEWVRKEGIRGNLTVAWDADEGVLERVEYVQPPGATRPTA